jgi:hypothetical protein
MAKRIDEQTLAILSKVTVTGNNIFLTCGTLDRKQYQAVDEILTHIGGKWNRSAKAHVYPTDPTDALEQVLLMGEIVPPKKYGYFPTPAAMAQRLVELAEIQHYHRILEPSAGQGGIAMHLPGGNVLDCIELLPDNVKVLKDKSFNVIHEGDFLDVVPNPIYARICMNPPFERQQDIRPRYACLGVSETTRPPGRNHGLIRHLPGEQEDGGLPGIPHDSRPPGAQPGGDFQGVRDDGQYSYCGAV